MSSNRDPPGEKAYPSPEVKSDGNNILNVGGTTVTRSSIGMVSGPEDCSFSLTEALARGDLDAIVRKIMAPVNDALEAGRRESDLNLLKQRRRRSGHRLHCHLLPTP